MGQCCFCLKFGQPSGYQSIPNPSPTSAKESKLSPKIEIAVQHRQAEITSVQSNPMPVASAPIEIGTGNTFGGGMSAHINSGANRKSSGSKSGFFVEFDLKEEIGIGSTAKCFRCVRKSDGKEFACKVVDKRQTDSNQNSILEQFFVEIKILRVLNHPHIIKWVDTFETSDRIYVIMEMMKGGELFDYVVEKGTLSEQEASVIIRNITSAIAHMHSLNIIHRDLKPENLLLTTKDSDAQVKIIDFGLAKEMADEAVTRSFLGTRGYLAPEMLQRHNYDKAVDIWALGVIAFVLLCGCLPFDDDSSRISSETAARKKFTLRFPKWAMSLSAPAKDLLHNLLDVNPKTRFTAEQALNHPWVSGKTVQPNSYLQSPSLLAHEKRKDMMKSPMMQAMQSRMAAAAGVPTGPPVRLNAAANAGSAPTGPAITRKKSF